MKGRKKMEIEKRVSDIEKEAKNGSVVKKAEKRVDEA